MTGRLLERKASSHPIRFVRVDVDSATEPLRPRRFDRVKVAQHESARDAGQLQWVSFLPES